MYCWNGPSPFGHGLPGPGHGAFRPEVKQRRLSPPSAPVTCRRPVGGGGVAGEQEGRVADRFGGRRVGRAHRSGGFHGGANRASGSNGGGEKSIAEGVTTPPPPNRNLVLRFGRSSSSNRNSEQLHNSSLWQDEFWMVKTDEVLTFPCCFFFSVIAPLYFEELDCFTPCDTILLIQDLDQMLRVRQVSLEWCHFEQHNVHICLQTLLQLRHVKYVVNSS
jgi:hypothetical protein